MTMSASQSQFSQNTANDDRTGGTAFNQAEYPNYEDDVGEHIILRSEYKVKHILPRVC